MLSSSKSLLSIEFALVRLRPARGVATTITSCVSAPGYLLGSFLAIEKVFLEGKLLRGVVIPIEAPRTDVFAERRRSLSLVFGETTASRFAGRGARFFLRGNSTSASISDSPAARVLVGSAGPSPDMLSSLPDSHRARVGPGEWVAGAAPATRGLRDFLGSDCRTGSGADLVDRWSRDMASLNGAELAVGVKVTGSIRHSGNISER